MNEEVVFEVDVCTSFVDDSILEIEKTTVTLPPDETAIYFSDAAIFGFGEFIDTEARKNIASRHIDFEEHVFEEGGTDSSYMDALDNLAEGYRIVGMRRIGMNKRFEVDAQYGESDEPFTDYFMAPDAIAAELQARWDLSVSEGANPLWYTFEEWCDVLDSHTVHWSVERSMTLDEASQLLSNVYAAHRDGGDIESAMADIEEALSTMGILPDAPSASLTL